MNLEELSFRNGVRFYSDRIRLVAGGELASTVFTKHERASLIRSGILSRGSNGLMRAGFGRRTVASERALDVLGIKEAS